MKKNIDYEELYSQFKDDCYEILKKVANKVEKNGLHTPIETVIHNICITQTPVSPSDKRLNKDFEILKNILSEPVLNERLKGDHVIIFIASTVWYRKDKLQTLQCEKEEANYRNFVKLITMFYEVGRQRYMNEEEKEILEKVLAIMWEYFHSENESKDLGVNSQNAKRIFNLTSKLDRLNCLYEEKELNNGDIVYKSCPIIAEWALEKCFEGFCHERYSIRALVEKFLPADVENIESEERRFSSCYSNNFKNNWAKEMKGVIDVEKISLIPATRVVNVELLYFASLSDSLLKKKSLGSERQEFAKKYIERISGQDLDVLLYIKQARILLALCGHYKISSNLLNCADYKLIDKIVDYLDKPVQIGGKEIYVSNPIVNNWIYVCHIASQLSKLAKDGNKLSASRKEFISIYINKIEGIRPFPIKLQYFLDSKKFTAAINENPWKDSKAQGNQLHVYSENSWLGQQCMTLDMYRERTVKHFADKCQKISQDTEVMSDDIILGITGGNFKKGYIKRTLHSEYERYMKVAIGLMYSLHN